MHTRQQEFLLEADFTDSTLKFNGFELNLKSSAGSFSVSAVDSIRFSFFFPAPYCMNLQLHSLYSIVYTVISQM